MAGSIAGRSIARFLSVAVCLAGLLAQSMADEPDRCDNRLEPGESAGPFFGMEFPMMAHILAEKVCGAKPIPMKDVFLQYLTDNGCGAQTAIYKEINESIGKLENADLISLATEGQRGITPEQARKWAEQAVEEFGGCPTLLKTHAKSRSRQTMGITPTSGQ